MKKKNWNLSKVSLIGFCLSLLIFGYMEIKTPRYVGLWDAIDLKSGTPIGGPIYCFGLLEYACEDTEPGQKPVLNMNNLRPVNAGLELAVLILLSMGIGLGLDKFLPKRK